MENVSAWSRSRLEPPFLAGAGADQIWSEPESAPEPRTSGDRAAQKCGGSATLLSTSANLRVDILSVMLCIYLISSTERVCEE